MPNVVLTIDSTYKTVRRPVMQSVATDVMANFGLGTSFTLHYSGTDDPEDLVVTDGGNTKHGEGFFSNTKILLTTDIEYVENSRSATVHYIHENEPLFKDNKLGLLISPNYARVKATLSFQVRCNDKTAALSLRSRIRQLFQIDHRGLYHDVKYMYLIPTRIDSLLSEIHRLREHQGGYGEDRETYFREHYNKNIDSVSNQSGSVSQLAMREYQNRILGSYDFQIAPDKPEVTDGKRYVLNFTYEFEYDEPLSLNVQYPLIVHNQLISPKFFDNAIPYEPGMIESKPSQTTSALDYYTNNNMLTKPYKGVPVPSICDWIPTNHQRGLFGIARFIIICDEDEPYSIINLNELDDIALKDTTLEYIKSNKERVLEYGRSPLHIIFYEDDVRVSKDDLYITDDLTFMLKRPMCIRKRYNMWLAGYEDLIMLRDNDVDALRKHTVFTEDVLLSLAPELASPPTQLPSKRADGVIIKEELLSVIGKIHEKKIPIRSNLNFSRRNVGFYIINALER